MEKSPFEALLAQMCFNSQKPFSTLCHFPTDELKYLLTNTDAKMVKYKLTQSFTFSSYFYVELLLFLYEFPADKFRDDVDR